jgi:ComF family protein
VPPALAGLPDDAAPRSYRRLLWGWHYRPPLDAVIAGLKFRRLDYLGRQLGEQLGRRFAAELAEADVAAPVPLGFWRRLGRGFDQAEAIAAAVAGAAGIRMEPLLVRRRSTAPQSLRGVAERRRNLAGAFAARPAVGRTWRGCHILLVDDVITTGATLEAASAALLEAGAGAVTVLVAARTPPPADRDRL